MKALVSGAAGFIGSNLAEALLQRGDSVVGFDNFSTGRRQNAALLEENPYFKMIEGDIRQAASIRQACRGIDVIFHLAAIPSVPRSIAEPQETFDANIAGTLNVLLAARECGVKRVVMASSSSIYGDVEIQPVHEGIPARPISPYGASKIAGENLGMSFAASYGFQFIALRYFNVFGPRQDPNSEYAAVVPKFISALLNGARPVIYGDGEQTRDFTFVDNIVRANLLAAESSVAADMFNIAAGRPHTVRELLRTLCDIFGKTFDPGFEPPRSGDIRHSSADIQKARSKLGYSPVTDLRGGLERTCKAYRAVAA